MSLHTGQKRPMAARGPAIVFLCRKESRKSCGKRSRCVRKPAALASGRRHTQTAVDVPSGPAGEEGKRWPRRRDTAAGNGQTGRDRKPAGFLSVFPFALVGRQRCFVEQPLRYGIGGHCAERRDASEAGVPAPFPRVRRRGGEKAGRNPGAPQALVTKCCAQRSNYALCALAVPRKGVWLWIFSFPVPVILLFHQSSAAVPDLTDFFSDGIIAVLHLVKGKGVDFAGVDLSGCI